MRYMVEEDYNGETEFFDGKNAKNDAMVYAEDLAKQYADDEMGYITITVSEVKDIYTFEVEEVDTPRFVTKGSPTLPTPTPYCPPKAVGCRF